MKCRHCHCTVDEYELTAGRFCKVNKEPVRIHVDADGTESFATKGGGIVQGTEDAHGETVGYRLHFHECEGYAEEIRRQRQ